MGGSQTRSPEKRPWCAVKGNCGNQRCGGKSICNPGEREREQRGNDRGSSEWPDCNRTGTKNPQGLLQKGWCSHGVGSACAGTSIFDEAYQGQQKENNNVLAFLDVIASDFSRLETETKKEESAAQTEFD